MKIPKKVKRCKKCKRIITEKNKSGYCCSCISNAKNAEKKKKICYVCEESCCGKMLIEHRNGQLISLCTFHFNWLNAIRDMKEIRKEIKRLKGCH